MLAEIENSRDYPSFAVRMKQLFQPGDVKIFRKVVSPADIAAFDGEAVHEVCATFALARDIEWSSRLFVLDMKDSEEEGIGTMLTIEHKGPALVGDELEIIAKVESLVGHELICAYEVRVGDRLVATGKTGQKIIKKDKLNRIFNSLKS
jgi:fluoroacetyl-CoA thioesterase